MCIRDRGIIDELDANGADVIEIGVPFSDPVADGPVVELSLIHISRSCMDEAATPASTSPERSSPALFSTSRTESKR